MTQPCEQIEPLIQSIRDAVERYIPKVTSLLPSYEGWRRGGWLCILTQLDSDLLKSFHVRVGTVPTAKDNKYLNYSTEKALRLSGFPDHMASRESRNPDAKQYTGAIRILQPHLIISFSGFSETDDEALLHAAAYNIDLENGAVVRAVTIEAPEIFDRWNQLIVI